MKCIIDIKIHIILSSASTPIFLARCAVGRDLFDLIVELQLSVTSAGFAEHIKHEPDQSIVASINVII